MPPSTIDFQISLAAQSTRTSEILERLAEENRSAELLRRLRPDTRTHRPLAHPILDRVDSPSSPVPIAPAREQCLLLIQRSDGGRACGELAYRTFCHGSNP